MCVLHGGNGLCVLIHLETVDGNSAGKIVFLIFRICVNNFASWQTILTWFLGGLGSFFLSVGKYNIKLAIQAKIFLITPYVLEQTKQIALFLLGTNVILLSFIGLWTHFYKTFFFYGNLIVVYLSIYLRSES